MEKLKLPTFDFSVKIVFKQDRFFFGPGPATLLTIIEETGSLSEASKLMNMSYTKAFNLVKYAEKALGFRLISRTSGGVGGGGSQLTDEGRMFLKEYTAYEEDVAAAAEELFQKRFR